MVQGRIRQLFQRVRVAVVKAIKKRVNKIFLYPQRSYSKKGANKWICYNQELPDAEKEASNLQENKRLLYAA
jgi:hypothetical protein